MSLYPWRIRLAVILTHLVVLAVFLGVGVWIDRQYGSSPKALLISLVLSFPCVQLISWRLIKRMKRTSV